VDERLPKRYDFLVPSERKTKRIIVRFALTKGEGEKLDGPPPTDDEKSDPRRMFTFFLDDSSPELLPSGVRIAKATVLYDGVSPGKAGEPRGAYSPSGELSSHPSPIIEFETSEPVKPSLLLRSVSESWVLIKASSQETGFYAEDWNGYTSVLSGTEARDWKSLLRDGGVYSGKTFDPLLLSRGIRADKM
jgi:hypothetical protein